VRLNTQKAKKGYKLVEALFKKFEEIPTDWEVKKLNQMTKSKADIVAGPFGSNLKVEDYTKEGVCLVRLQNIHRNQFVDVNIVYINKAKAEELKYHSFKGGDLLLAKLGEPIGPTCEAPQYIKTGILVGDVVRIRIDPEKTSKKFIEYLLNSRKALIHFTREKIGTTRPRINLSHVRDFAFPCPSTIEEQEKIAQILSNVDNAIQNIILRIKQTQRLEQGMIQTLLTKGFRDSKFKKIKWNFKKFIEIPEDWKVVPLSDEVFFQEGPGLRNWQFTKKGMKVINVSNLVDGYLDISNTDRYISQLEFEKTYMHFAIELDDVVVASSGNSFGKVAIVRKKDLPLMMNTSVIRFRPLNESLDRNFLQYFLESDIFKRQINMLITGSAQPNFGPYHIKRVKFLKPPLPEQRKIASIISNIHLNLREKNLYKANLELLKHGLIQNLLTGQIRLYI